MIATGNTSKEAGQGFWGLARGLRSGGILFLLRGLGVAAGAVGGIWVARALGPEKLGISTFILGLLGLAAALTSLNQDYNFVRRGKNLPKTESLDGLVDEVFSLRLGLGLALASVAFVACMFWRPDPVWYLPIAVGLVLILIQCNDAGWILQLRNRMPRFFVGLSVQSLVTASLCLAFIRPDWPAGSDLVFALAGNALAFWLVWRWACGGPVRIRVSLANFLSGVRLLRSGLWLALMGLGMYALSSAEIPLIAALASVEELGIYRTAMQFINVINPFVPLFFFRLYPQLIELQQRDPSAVLGVQFVALGRVSMLGTPLIVAAFFLAPIVYPVVFGQIYAVAALPFSFLFAAKVVSVAVNIFMWGALARHMDKHVVILTLSAASLCIGLNCLFIPRFGILSAALVSCFGQLILLAGNISFMAISSRRPQSTVI